ncbi:MAG: iron ABC transporter permease, partial [Clostridiales bacterium]|nr:iron ABC transporter permease [Clostridiales bacterium]
MNKLAEHYSWRTYVFYLAALIGAMLLCICVGSVSIPLADTVAALWNSLFGLEVPAGISKNIIINVRLPRVLNVALVGAALSLCGAAMQGLLRNPLADGSTLGVSSGASLGAV